MPPLVKICGLSTPVSIEAALYGGASHIGLVHFEKSPRHVTLAEAAKLRAVVGDKAKVAVLLVNAAPALVGEVLASIAPISSNSMAPKRQTSWPK